LQRIAHEHCEWQAWWAELQVGHQQTKWLVGVFAVTLAARGQAHASLAVRVYVEVNGLLVVDLSSGLKVAELPERSVAEACVLHAISKRGHHNLFDVASGGTDYLRSGVHDQML
jgi:hypothetical protein